MATPQSVEYASGQRRESNRLALAALLLSILACACIGVQVAMAKFSVQQFSASTTNSLLIAMGVVGLLAGLSAAVLGVIAYRRQRERGIALLALVLAGAYSVVTGLRVSGVIAH